MIERIVVKDWIEDELHVDFVLNKSDNGTIFHLTSFLSYHSESFFQKKQKLHFKFFKKNKLISSIIGIAYTDNGKKYFLSPYGASYGGIVVAKNIDYNEYETIVDSLIEYLTQESFDRIKTTCTLSIHSAKLKSNYGKFILMSKGFQITKSELLLAHKLSSKKDLISRFEKKTISELNQSLNNPSLSCKITNGVDRETYQILLSSQKRLQSVPTHTLEQLNRIEELLPGAIKTFKIFHKENLISGIITFKTNVKVLTTFYIFDNEEARDLKANHYAYYNVMKWAQENEFKYLDFGPSSFGYKPNYPLIKFKEKFDPIPVLKNTFYKELKA